MNESQRVYGRDLLTTISICWSQLTGLDTKNKLRGFVVELLLRKFGDVVDAHLGSIPKGTVGTGKELAVLVQANLLSMVPWGRYYRADIKTVWEPSGLATVMILQPRSTVEAIRVVMRHKLVTEWPDTAGHRENTRKSPPCGFGRCSCGCDKKPKTRKAR